MTTETLFTLRLAPAFSEEHARAIAPQRGTTAGTLELRVLPVDADGRVTAVASREDATRVLIDLRVVPVAEPTDTAGYRLQSPTPGPVPEPPRQVWQICPGVAVRVTRPDAATADDQDVQGFLWMAWPMVAGGFFAGYGVEALLSE
jgi:hypothetical protein